MANINVEREDASNGTIITIHRANSTLNWLVSPKPFDHGNYCISSKVHPFITVEIENLNFLDDFMPDHPSDRRLANCFGHFVKDNTNLMLSFIWGVGVETKKTASLFRRTSLPEYQATSSRAADGFVNITINQRPNCVCLTRLALDCPDPIWGANSYREDTSVWELWQVLRWIQ